MSAPASVYIIIKVASDFRPNPQVLCIQERMLVMTEGVKIMHNVKKPTRRHDFKCLDRKEKRETNENRS